MERRGYQAMLMGGEEGSDSGPYSPPSFITDDSSINAFFSAMDPPPHSFLHSLHYAYGPFPPTPSSLVNPPTSGFLTHEHIIAGQTEEEVSPDRKLKMPKIEASNLNVQQLPDLRSLEQVHHCFGFAESSSRKRTLESTARNFQFGLNLPEIHSPATVVMPQSTLARQRRQRISEKTRCLQKLLPWDKKMDMATMLEEAYKYVKFLQAQISVLQSMPCNSSSFEAQNHGNVNVIGGMGRLNRQQLLQVVVNSPVVQTTLYSRGCCVYSMEQLVLLKKIAERKAIYQQMVFDPSTLP
ncbi:Transcription factor bHLH117 [Camellia lanceoleosa]|uniref:Transcription factor bHLH117 n=1 Tax=Camellia lanceoleosa TaxID=1840588 RepID=A0ACC0HCD0_9ERIC|nr:Transcription factor bHLH117 [Camellia lanceoleosa]